MVVQKEGCPVFTVQKKVNIIGKKSRLKDKKVNIKGDTARFAIIIAAVIIIVGAALSFSLYFVIQKSFFRATVSHEMELMRIMETLGSRLVDSRLHDLKMEAENTAAQFAEDVRSGIKEEEALSSIKLEDDRLNYCYQTRDELIVGEQFHGDYAAQLDLTKVWEGETVLFSPDFDAEENFILAIAVPVWKDQGKRETEGVLIEQLDGFCISRWIREVFLALDIGTAYIIDGTGRNIATVREENFDWITTRYNSQELVKEYSDESTKTVARLEKYALDGKTGIDTYVWEGSTNYVAYGPLTETDWGFFVGFYGNQYKEYTQNTTSISSRIAVVILIAFALFLCAIIAGVMRILGKERKYNTLLVQQKAEIEEQALRIAVSEERFRIAMQRSRDIILEYQLETGDITCFLENREVKSGRVGDRALRKQLIGDCCLDEESFERFTEVMRAMGKGLMTAECMLTGDTGTGRRWYNMSVTAIPDSTRKSTRAVGVLRDITSEREAEMDSLTRLLNKAAMTAGIEAAVQKNGPYTASAFVILDVDYFKAVNDNYGHPAGDEVLCAIGDCLREIFPEPYLISRFGGDEFSIFCPSVVDRQELEGRLKQLSDQAGKIRLKNGSYQNVTLSIGGVIFYGKAQFERIYKKADEMLYQVKESGRNNCRVCEETNLIV